MKSTLELRDLAKNALTRARAGDPEMYKYARDLLHEARARELTEHSLAVGHKNVTLGSFRAHLRARCAPQRPTLVSGGPTGHTTTLVTGMCPSQVTQLTLSCGCREEYPGDGVVVGDTFRCLHGGGSASAALGHAQATVVRAEVIEPDVAIDIVEPDQAAEA